MTDFTLSRRTLLAGAATVPLLPQMALGDGHTAAGPASRLAHSYTVGDFRVTTLLDAAAPRDEPQSLFATNVDAEEFAAVSAENFISATTYTSFIAPVVVEAGDDIILFDTGLGNGGVMAALAQAGIAPDAVTHVVITHFHPDHIGGLIQDEAPAFPNASYVAGRVEFDFWTGPGAASRMGPMVERLVVPFADRMTFLEDGQDVRSGISAMATFGHTPGHLAFMLESGSSQMLLTADMTNHHVWSLAYPDWDFQFDADKDMAAATRRRVLGMLASERVAMLAYHLPFPAAGFVETRGDGFHWVPASYQFG